MSGIDTTTTRLSRERLLNLIYEAPQYNSGVVQIVDNVVALFNERDAYMTALEQQTKRLDTAYFLVKTFVESVSAEGWGVTTIPYEAGRTWLKQEEEAKVGEVLP